MFPFLQKIGPGASQKLRERVANDLFAQLLSRTHDLDRVDRFWELVGEAYASDRFGPSFVIPE